MAVEDLYDDGGKLGVELTVQRYRWDGALTGVARLPGEAFVIAPRRAAEVAPDGTLYAMVPAQNGTTIYRVSMGQTYRSLIADQATQPDISANTAGSGADSTVGAQPEAAIESPDRVAIGTAMAQAQQAQCPSGVNKAGSAPVTSACTRREVRQRASAMADTTWTWQDKYNYFPLNPKLDNGNGKPIWLDKKDTTNPRTPIQTDRS
jgi:hypothetical protein